MQQSSAGARRQRGPGSGWGDSGTAAVGVQVPGGDFRRRPSSRPARPPEGRKAEEPNPPAPFPKREGGARTSGVERLDVSRSGLNSRSPPSVLGKGVGG